MSKIKKFIAICAAISLLPTQSLAFLEWQETPSGTNFQSGESPMLTKEGGIFDRAKMSLEALSEAIGKISSFREWDPDKFYSAGDLVIFNKKIYKTANEISKIGNSDPSVDTTNWSLVLEDSTGEA